MTFDLDDLRSVFDEAVAENRDNPNLLADLERRRRRDARCRGAVLAAAATVVAALVTVPLMAGGERGGPVVSPVKDDLPRGLPTEQDPGPRLDLRKGPEPVVGDIPTVDGEAYFPLPFDRYRPAPMSEIKIDWAVDQKARACLRGFGFDLPEIPVPLFQDRPDIALIGAYGIAHLERAATHGYRFTPTAGGSGSMDPVEGPAYRKMGKDVASVYFGEVTAYRGRAVPEQGCLGEARRALGWTSAFYWVLVQRLPKVALQYTLQDRRVTAVTRRWSECMRRSGFSYDSPQKAMADPAWRKRKVTAEEIATAKADIACKRETNLLGVGLTVQAAYEQQLIERNITVLAPLEKRLAQVEANVDRFVQERRP